MTTCKKVVIIEVTFFSSEYKEKLLHLNFCEDDDVQKYSLEVLFIVHIQG